MLRDHNHFRHERRQAQQVTNPDLRQRLHEAERIAGASRVAWRYVHEVCPFTAGYRQTRRVTGEPKCVKPRREPASGGTKKGPGMLPVPFRKWLFEQLK